MSRFPLALPLALLGAAAAGLAALPGSAWAADPPQALARSAEPDAFRDRRLLDLYMRGDVLELFTRTHGLADKGGKPAFFEGMFLADLGLAGAARPRLEAATASLPKGDPFRDAALARSLSLSRFDTTRGAAPRVPEGVRGRAALDLGGFVLEGGDLAGGLSVVRAAEPGTPAEKAMGAAVAAQALAASGKPSEALSLLDSFHAPETAPSSDLVYLLRAYHHLSSGDVAEARDSFLAIPAESLFAPEARHGLAWVQIRSGNLPGAVVRFEELLRDFPASPVARMAVVDLALTYRDLGLHDKAADLLNGELRRLTEGRKWLEALGPADLAAGRDLPLLVEDALRGSRAHPEAWKRAPAFARDFALSTSSDPGMLRLGALEQGARRLAASASGLKKQYAEVRARLTAHRAWLAGLDKTLAVWRSSASGHLGRLPSLRGQYVNALQGAPLKEGAGPDHLLLLDRLSRSKERLLFLTTAQEKARGFSGVIRELTGADLPMAEQKQLSKIRQEAFDGILQTRDSVGDLEERLKSLEGKVWFEVKKAAAVHQAEVRKLTQRLETSAAGTIGQAVRALEMARERDGILAAKAQEVDRLEKALSSALGPRLDKLSSSLAAARASRILALARERARSLRDAEARVLYTAADVEIAKMDERLKALQQGGK